jgi:hypothetical protein
MAGSGVGQAFGGQARYGLDGVLGIDAQGCGQAGGIDDVEVSIAVHMQVGANN